MTCTSRFFQSETLLRELFPGLHGADSGRDGLSPKPSADAPPESERDDSPGIAELDGGPEIAEHIVEDRDPSGAPNALPSPTVV